MIGYQPRRGSPGKIDLPQTFAHEHLAYKQTGTVAGQRDRVDAG